MTFQSPLRFVLPGFDPLQPGDLTLQSAHLLLRGLPLLDMPLVRGGLRLDQLVKLSLALLIHLSEPLHLHLQALRKICSRHKKS